MYRSGWVRRVSGSSELFLVGKGSRIEFFVEGGGVSRCLDGFYCMIYVSYKIGLKG